MGLSLQDTRAEFPRREGALKGLDKAGWSIYLSHMEVSVYYVLVDRLACVLTRGKG